MDFRLDYLDRRLASLKQQINLAVSDVGRLLPLMNEYKEMQNMRNEIAKKIGRRIR
jgi:DNA primase